MENSLHDHKTATSEVMQKFIDEKDFAKNAGMYEMWLDERKE